jgi:hypothetical protein
MTGVQLELENKLGSNFCPLFHADGGAVWRMTNYLNY